MGPSAVFHPGVMDTLSLCRHLKLRRYLTVRHCLPVSLSQAALNWKYPGSQTRREPQFSCHVMMCETLSYLWALTASNKIWSSVHFKCKTFTDAVLIDDKCERVRNSRTNHEHNKDFKKSLKHLQNILNISCLNISETLRLNSAAATCTSMPLLDAAFMSFYML